jgi:hypothetical protein
VFLRLIEDGTERFPATNVKSATLENVQCKIYSILCRVSSHKIRSSRKTAKLLTDFQDERILNRRRGVEAINF